MQVQQLRVFEASNGLSAQPVYLLTANAKDPALEHRAHGVVLGVIDKQLPISQLVQMARAVSQASQRGQEAGRLSRRHSTSRKWSSSSDCSSAHSSPYSKVNTRGLDTIIGSPVGPTAGISVPRQLPPLNSSLRISSSTLRQSMGSSSGQALSSGLHPS